MHPTLLLAPLAFHTLADVDYSFNTNLPPQHESFIPGTGSTAKRAAGISGTPKKLAEATGTAEWRPLPNLTLKLEGRYDHSTAPVFFGHDLDPAGDPTFKQHQVLFVLGAVAYL